MLYSIIVPCYNSGPTIRKVVEMTSKQLDSMGKSNYEFVLVDDHSPDGGKTIQELKSLVKDYDFVKVVELAQNSGQHNATMAALNNASGDVIISMDDDMQTHPSQLPILIEEFEKGFDIVYGYYPEKKHNLFRNFGSYVNYLSVRFLIGKPKDMKTSSFWIIRRFVRDYIVEYKSPYTHLQGLFLRTTRNISSVPIKHFERESGTSNYTFKKLLNLWSNIIGYSIAPLRLAQYLGGLLSIGGLLGALIVLIKKLLVPTTALGWSSVMVAIFFFSGIILLFLGIIGEYIGRMFLGMNHQPQYVVRNIYTNENKGDA